MLTLESVSELIRTRFGGRVVAGKHPFDGEGCLHEIESAALGIAWTDEPQLTRSFDRRPLNDIDVPGTLRAEYAARLIVAYQGSLDWPIERQVRVAERLAIWTIQRVVSELPGLPKAIQELCRAADDLSAAKKAADEAEAVAWVAAEVAAVAAVRAARGAARAATWAAGAAAAEAADGAEARERIFRLNCELWLAAAII